MRKSLGSYKGKILKQSYHLDDEFKFVIIELATYHNQFCIIPKQELANKLTKRRSKLINSFINLDIKI
jgi:hypothetical protein